MGPLDTHRLGICRRVAPLTVAITTHIRTTYMDSFLFFHFNGRLYRSTTRRVHQATSSDVESLLLKATVLLLRHTYGIVHVTS